MQDWNYIHGGCFELTLEISDVKWPKAAEVLLHLVFYASAPSVANHLMNTFCSVVSSNLLLQLPVIWEHNRMSMLNLVASLVKVRDVSTVFSFVWLCTEKGLVLYYLE